jgi:L-threonylcarbamoyladenylate synthase
MTTWTTVDPVQPAADVIDAAVRALLAGGVVAYPTDTLYGLAIDPRQPGAVARLFEAKGRSQEAAIPLVAAETEQVARDVGPLSELATRLAGQFWPGPLTLVIEAHPELDRRLLGGGTSVAVRVPDHAVARALAARLGSAVTATSANTSGGVAPDTARAVRESLGVAVTFGIDGGRTAGGAPSTIVDTRGTSPVLLRDGRVDWDRVVQSLA